MIGWQFAEPTPPPTGSVTRITVSRIWWSARGLGVAAVGDALAVDVVLAAPFAVVVTVEAEVEAGAELEAGVGQDLDVESASVPSAVVARTRPPRSRRFAGSYLRSGTRSSHGSYRPSGCSIPPMTFLWRSRAPTICEVQHQPVAASRRRVSS